MDTLSWKGGLSILLFFCQYAGCHSTLVVLSAWFMDAGIDMILSNITKVIRVVRASYRVLFAEDVQILKPCADTHFSFKTHAFVLSFIYFNFKFTDFRVLMTRKARQRARGTVLWQQQLAAIDEFPWRCFTKPVMSFSEKWPSSLYVGWNWNRKACLPGAQDRQTTLVPLHSTFLLFFFFVSWESWQRIWILPRGRKLHFRPAYKTKQDRKVICSSSHIYIFFVSRLFGSICENNSH